MSTYEEELRKLDEKHAAAREALKLEHEVRALLPPDIPPKQVYTGIRLYGARTGVKYGDSFESYSFRDDPAYKKRTLREALDLLVSIGEIVPFFSVKDGCLALKPEAAITERERERHADIRGPYDVKVVNDQGSGASLEAFVRLSNGELITVDIVLDHRARSRFGYWSRVGGHEHYSESWQFRVQPSEVGQAQLVRYASGSSTGPHSGSRQVYLFTSIKDLDPLAASLEAEAFAKDHIIVAKVGD